MNKKLLKSILCITSGVAIATSILFTTASCGSSSEKKQFFTRKCLWDRSK